MIRIQGVHEHKWEVADFYTKSLVNQFKNSIWLLDRDIFILKQIYLKQMCWASLVAQWLRIRLPMQGTRVRALVQEYPTCRGAAKPMCHNYWVCVPQLLKPTCLEPMLRNKRSHHNEKTAHCNEEQLLFTATRESLHAATKTQHSQTHTHTHTHTQSMFIHKYDEWNGNSIWNISIM